MKTDDFDVSPKKQVGITKDSYSEFLDYFEIEKKEFYSFGLDNTIYAEIEVVQRQWDEIKNKLLSNRPLYIRSYGRRGRHSELFVELYRYVFGNENILIDPTNNNAPRRNLQEATGYKLGKTLLNYQCSHIFGHTKNPLLFEAVWNICFTPKLFDPLTGHEAKGEWPKEYQQMFRQAVFLRYHELIVDYNRFCEEWKVDQRIDEFISLIAKNYDAATIDSFRKDALAEWAELMFDE